MTAQPVIVGTCGHPSAGPAVHCARSLAPLLAAPVLTELAGRVDADPNEVILGNCMGPGGNVARVAALAAGLPPRCPASPSTGSAVADWPPSCSPPTRSPPGAAS